MQLTFNVALTLAMITFVTVAAPRAEAQQHSMKIRVDTLPSPSGYPTGTGTSGYLHINLETTTGWLFDGANSTVAAAENNDFCVTVDEATVTGVEFVIDDNGTDALWIDQWRTWSYNTANCTGTPTHKQDFGIDDRLGFCMSEDASWYRSNDPIVCDLTGVDGYTNGWDWGPSKVELFWNY